MFAEAIEDILRDQCTPAVVRAIEAGGSTDALWRALEGSGFLDLLKPESEGGAGLPLAELYPVLAVIGRHAPPVPLAQAMAARALVAEGVALPEGLLTLAPALLRSGDGAVTAPNVPYGDLARHVLGELGGQLVLLDATQATRVGDGVVGSQCATLTWTPDRVRDDKLEACRTGGDATALAPMAAAIHAALLAGAMARVFEMTLGYCNDRVQFGRSLGKFQAVQHQLAVMAELVAAASVAADGALQSQGRTPDLLRAAIAKSRASEAARAVADTAHALHGAIGVTAEYDLQLLTRRLHAWRVAHGSEAYWNGRIGQAVLGSDQTLSEFVRAVF